MKTFLIFLLCLLSVSSFSQSVAIRSSSGQGTNLTLKGSGALKALIVDTNKLVVSTNGNVGLGTNTPQASLHVNGGTILEDNFYDIRGFGAVEDATVDNSAAIQLAINTVGASGGGIVFFPVGRWRVPSAAGASVLPGLAWSTNNNVTLRGAGKDKTILFNDRITTGGDGGMVIGFTTSVDNITIEDIGFENRGSDYVAANAGAALLYFADGTKFFNNIVIRRCSFLTSNRTAITFGANITNYVIADCDFDGPQETAIYLAQNCNKGQVIDNRMPLRGTPTNSSVGIAIRAAQDLIVSRNRVENCGLYGILCRDNANRRVHIIENEVMNGAVANSAAIAVSSGNDIVVQNNLVDGWPFGIEAAFSVASTNITIDGNHIHNTTFTAIRVTGATAQGYDVSVKGNHASQTGQGIRVANMSNGPVTVAYNIIDSVATVADYGLLSTANPAGVVNWGPNYIRNYSSFDTASGWNAGTNMVIYGNVGLGAAPDRIFDITSTGQGMISRASGANSVAVYGYNTASSGTVYGMYGQTTAGATLGYGVNGIAGGVTGTGNYGVFGSASGSSGFNRGVSGSAPAGANNLALYASGGARSLIDGDLYVYTNAFFAGRASITNGIASWTNNAVASAAITFPATTATWTNTTGINIVLYIDNTGVTGTAIAKNGQQIFGGLSVDVTLLLKPNDYFSETYSAGTPTARWEPQ